jgi:O-antigen ligase
MCVALALMLVGVLFSLSRGGFVALVGGFTFCLLVRLSCRGWSLRWGAGLLCLGLALGLGGWLGLGQVEARLGTLWHGKALQESRMPVWSDALRPVTDFPLWGAGYGTYQFVEPLYRTTALLANEIIDHVHNEYLEVLVEGGLVGLVLALLAIGLILRQGYRAARGHTSRRARALALGALLAFVTVVIHSVGDFGLHIPAIALLTAVICAQLSALGEGAGKLAPNHPGQQRVSHLPAGRGPRRGGSDVPGPGVAGVRGWPADLPDGSLAACGLPGGATGWNRRSGTGHRMSRGGRTPHPG